jgi:hypothetical protein
VKTTIEQGGEEREGDQVMKIWAKILRWYTCLLLREKGRRNKAKKGSSKEWGKRYKKGQKEENSEKRESGKQERKKEKRKKGIEGKKEIYVRGGNEREREKKDAMTSNKIVL